MDWLVWLFRVLWLLGVIVLTIGLLTTEAAQATGEVVPEEMSFGVSKTVHVLAYLCLTVLLALSRWPLPVALGGLALLVAHAGLTECLQTFIPLRSGSVRDVGLDCLGILLGLVLTCRIWLRRPAVQLAADRRGGTAA